MTTPSNAIVKTTNDRGFLFALVGDKDVFVHRSAFTNPADFNDAREGDALLIEVDYSAPKGPRATKAKLTESEFPDASPQELFAAGATAAELAEV